MATLSKTLPVPFFTQPTPITCQSSVLKMFARYLEAKIGTQPSKPGAREIGQIWKEINTGTQRPHQVRNSHANMKWWLEQHFPMLDFPYETMKNPEAATEKIVAVINDGFPVLVSVSHARVKGHIILVVGYEHYIPASSSPDFRLVVHDPYGRFDPSLSSEMFGTKRWDEGACLASGSELGPGANNRVPVSSISRQRSGDQQRGTFYLLFAAEKMCKIPAATF